MLQKRPKGILCDITGVLKDSVNGIDVAIDQSLEAFNRLKNSGIPIVLCSNESACSTSDLCDKLNYLGYSISVDKVLTPVSAIVQLIKDNNYRPHILVSEKIESEFEEFDQTNPNVVVVGDAAGSFTYQNMDNTFKLLVGGERKFYCLGKTKYYMDSGELKLDLGCFVAGLEYSSQVEAEVVGKPSRTFFTLGCARLGLDMGDVVMIGDDIEGDVGGAMETGCQGILVRTGKFRESDETHPRIKPTFIAANFHEAVDVILNA